MTYYNKLIVPSVIKFHWPQALKLVTATIIQSDKSMLVMKLVSMIIDISIIIIEFLSTVIFHTNSSLR